MANPNDHKPFRVVDEDDNFLEDFPMLEEADHYMGRREGTYLTEGGAA